MKRTKQIGEACSRCKRTDVRFYSRYLFCVACHKQGARTKRSKNVGDQCSKCKRADVEFYPKSSACKACNRADHKAWRERTGYSVTHARMDECTCGRYKDHRSVQCMDCHDRRRSLFHLKNNVKICKTCLVALPGSAFRASSNTSDKLRPDCTTCLKKKGRVGACFRKYGITIEQWNALYVNQDGKCGACRIPLQRHSFDGIAPWAGEGRSPCVDHCHETGAIRGMLCHWCNLTVNEHASPEALRGCADYLERWQNRAICVASVPPVVSGDANPSAPVLAGVL